MLTIYGGRTRRLWPEMLKKIKAARAEKRRVLMLVPEQYTLQAESDLLRDLKLPGFFDMEVLSLSRFVQRMFAQCGAQNRVRVDGSGKNIAVASALVSTQEKLHYYGRAAKRRGFITQAGRWIADIKRSRLTPEALSAYGESLNEGAYRRKIEDLALLYKTYSGILSDKFVDGEDVQACAADAAARSDMVRDADVFVYGFDVITDDFANILCSVTENAADVSVYLVMEREDAPDGDYFKPVRDSAERLRNKLRDRNLKRGWQWVENVPLDAPGDIQWLEREILRPVPKKYDGIPQSITLYDAANPAAEAQYIAREILACTDRGIPFEEINVVCGSIDGYASLFRSVFASYGIPAFITVKEPLLSHGIVQLLLGAVRAVTGGYRPEDMLTLIKSGYAPLTEEEGWELENYIFTCGISGSRWRSPFRRGDESTRTVPEEARKKIMPLLSGLQDGLREATNAAESLLALTNFLTDCGCTKTLLAQEEQLVQKGMEAEAARTRQVWKAVLSLFEQMHEIAGEARIPGSVIASWIEAGLTETSIASLPSGGGCVTVGEVGNLIVREPEVVFVCGLNTEENGGGNALLNEDEKGSMSRELKVYLGMTPGEQELMRETDYWKVMSAPRKELHLSHAQATQNGSALRTAPALQAVKRVFDKIVTESSLTGASIVPLSPVSALNTIGGMLRTGNVKGEWLEAWKWFLMSPEYRPMALSLEYTARGEKEKESLEPAFARTVFPERLVSASRLEEYASCPYKHFVEYGLHPAERLPWQPNRSDEGTFYHDAMQGFAEALAGVPNWPDISREQCDGVMDAALADLTKEWENEAIGENARTMAEGRRYLHACKRAAWVMTKGAQQSKFRTARAEVTFGYEDSALPPLKLRLPDGTFVSVCGRIDRIDRYEGDDGAYLRIVDYKSSNKELKAGEIQLGLQLQLLLYLEAASRNDFAEPAGAFYQHIGNPLTEQEGILELAEDELARALCLKGVALSDLQVIRLMDSATPPVTLNGTLTKKNEPNGKVTCTKEEMRRLLDFACGVAARLTENIRAGEIAPSAVSFAENKTACDFCAYSDICRKDVRTVQMGRKVNKDLELHDLVGKEEGTGDFSATETE